ncbi:alpha/beta hydrolase [Lacinutrix sp. C3R15]|uniref:alpha/beta fold hydrolase n=1 Tax=Flavobacteriaceae TaxID=49546 RepID=UPI001C099A3A|nr:MULTISPECIES: alpha/beta hydrolase [Flavobacteriaceae]MBU2940207.1 alpha/beta hydrolase [Lacinutrix sp. C3R15]MDO6623524.1 alpha/beta hydrolase [Oceanihabitans sp. 1_MG-2023]
MRIFLVLALSTLLLSCNDPYKKFKKTPDYITNASGIDQSYLEAYDETLKLWNVTYEALYIPTTHGIAHVLVSGPADAAPVVLLHGMDASSTMWYPNIEALSKNHRVFAIDFLLEAGKSHVYDKMDNKEEVTKWYQEVLFALQLENYHLIGASRGGWLAVNLALNNQKSIKSMVLLSPAQTFTWIKPSTDLFKNIVSLLSSKEKQMEQSLESMSTNVANISDAYLAQYAIALKKESENQFVASMQPFSNSELKSLQMPVLVLIGDDDMINEKRTIEIAKMLPQGKGEVIRNAGHFLSIDQAEIVNAKMLGFLE